jgi:hypothetical protein
MGLYHHLPVGLAPAFWSGLFLSNRQGLSDEGGGQPPRPRDIFETKTNIKNSGGGAGRVGVALFKWGVTRSDPDEN